MSNAITATYHDVSILYREEDNRWVFELRGRERSVESLEAAKKAIDAPEPKDKKPFARVRAYFKRGYGGDKQYEVVEVTSLAESSYGAEYVWIVNSKKNRSKERAMYLFPVCLANDKRISEIEALAIEVAKLRRQIEQIEGTLEPLKVAE